MLAARPSAIPGRRHKMVFVDFSNPYLRHYLANRYLREHVAHVDAIRRELPAWLASSRAEEEKLAASRGCRPRPLAAVVDIDEVVLGNIHMNSFGSPAGAQGEAPVDFHASDYYTAPNGAQWPRGDHRLNPLLPGSRRLLEELRAAGCAIFFVTGRLETIRDETVENFIFVGLCSGDRPLWSADELRGPGTLIMCPADAAPAPGESIRPFKEAQRRLIESSHRIAVNVGDQVSDLGLHGDVQVLLPHPFYYTP